MQETGQPPPEIVKMIVPEAEQDANGNPVLPGLDNENCSIM